VVAGLMARIGIAGATMVNAVLLRSLNIYGLLAGSSLIIATFWSQIVPENTRPQTLMISFYQHALGHLDGRSCPSYPVCSSYAREAMDSYGMLFGSWLMLDRLIHEADDLHQGTWIIYEGEKRLYDPLSHNDYLLQGEGL